MAANLALGCGFAEIRGLPVNGQYHVALFVCYDCIEVGCCIFEEPFDKIDCVLGGHGLVGCCERAEASDDGGVNGASVVK